MGVDPKTMQVTEHFDTWDAIDQQGFFLRTGSPQGVAEVLRQIFDITKQPDLETPDYLVLRRYAEYEVRRRAVPGGRDGDGRGRPPCRGGMTGPPGGNPFGTLWVPLRRE